MSPRFSMVLTAALFLAAWQTVQGSLLAASLEESKEVSENFEQPAFVAPPRTITDVTQVLEVHRDTNQEELAKSQREASESPPAGIDTKELIHFYRTRGDAAGKAGLPRQQIDDYGRALRLLREAGLAEAGEYVTEGALLFAMSHAEGEAGNFTRAIDLRRKSIAATSSSGRLMDRYARLAYYQIQIGDIAGAEESQQEYLELEPSMLDWGSEYDVLIPLVEAHLRYTDAVILRSKGDYKRAEATSREGMTQLALSTGEDQRQLSVYDLGTVRILFRAVLSMELSNALLKQGRLAEAEVEARKALSVYLKRFGKISHFTANILTNFAIVLLEQNRLADVAVLAKTATDIFDELKVPPKNYNLARARSTLGKALAAQSLWRKAAKSFGRIETDLSREIPELFNHRYRGDTGWALSLVRTSEPERAMKNLQASYTRLKELLGDDAYDAAETRGMMGVARSALGLTREALADFRAAFPVLIGNDEGIGTQQIFYRKAILEAYLELLSGIRESSVAGSELVAEAFVVANAARGQGVDRALAESAARVVISAASADPELARLARQEQDMRQQIGALGQVLSNTLAAGESAVAPAVIDSLRQSIQHLRGARVILLREVEERFPDYAALLNPKVPTLADTRAVLKSSEALIFTYVSEQRTYVWAVPRSGTVTFAAVDFQREALEETVGLLRSSLEPNALTLGDIPEFDIAKAYGLYKKLLAPVGAGWQGAKNLLVVAHGPLGYLPFSLLPTKKTALGAEKEPLFSNYRAVPWLARSHAVTMLPSAASLMTLRGLPPGNKARNAFAGFGDPWFSEKQAAEAQRPQVTMTAVTARGNLRTRGIPLRLRAAPRTRGVDSAELALLPRLPDTADEVTAIGLTMHANLTKSVFLGREANEGRVKSMDLSGFKVLVFATHGLLPGDLNGLTQPALALSSPKVVGGKDDGLLTMGEIMGLKLDADWVVLSACNTASGDGAGAEAVSGLGRAFFYAGTRALLVSNWPVESNSARLLTTDLFRRQADDPTLSRAEALRQSMMALMDKPGFTDDRGRILYFYAHPLFWAPFSLIGDGG